MTNKSLSLRRDEKFILLDNILTQDEFRHLWKFIQKLKFDLPSGQWQRLSQITDPPQLGSETFFWSSGTLPGALNCVAERLVDETRRSKIFGVEGEDWCDIGFRVFLHSRGSRLACHADTPLYVGAAVFYAHPIWLPSWGGELFFPDLPLLEELQTNDDALDENIEKILSDQGSGIYLSPKPNRMIIIRGGALHATNRIDADAGSNMRCSVSAFFLRHKTPQPGNIITLG